MKDLMELVVMDYRLKDRLVTNLLTPSIDHASQLYQSIKIGFGRRLTGANPSTYVRLTPISGYRPVTVDHSV